jgi:hypothetical protein
MTALDPLLPSKIGPANGMQARESGLRLKAWRCTRGGYSATAAQLPLRAWRRSARPLANGSSPCSSLRPSHSTNWPERWRLGARLRVALLELELGGRVKYLADRIALCASANENICRMDSQWHELFSWCGSTAGSSDSPSSRSPSGVP